MAAAGESGKYSAQISRGQQLMMADLWGIAGSAVNATPEEAARATSGDDAISAPAQSATPVVLGPYRVSWDDRRARLQAEADARRAKRRQRRTAGSSATADLSNTSGENGGMWDGLAVLSMTTTPLPAVGAASDTSEIPPLSPVSLAPAAEASKDQAAEANPIATIVTSSVPDVSYPTTSFDEPGSFADDGEDSVKQLSMFD
jgi:hypothetical protein